MKLLFRSAVLAIFVWSLNAHAQSVPLAGFVFANAVGVNGNADITASGKRLTRKGLEPGMATSGLGLPVGPYQLQITAPTCQPAQMPLTIAAGSTPIIVAFLERRTDPRTNLVTNFVRTLQLAAAPQEDKYIIKAMAVDPAVNFNVTAGGQTQMLQAFKPTILETKSLKVSDSTGAVEQTHVTEKGSYYCFIFRKADGKPGISVVPERIYQW